VTGAKPAGDALRFRVTHHGSHSIRYWNGVNSALLKSWTQSVAAVDPRLIFPNARFEFIN
jgi:hypothetical protein